jgi:hypothetical protein
MAGLLHCPRGKLVCNSWGLFRLIWFETDNAHV